MIDRVGPRRRLVDPAAANSEPFRTLRLALQLRSDASAGNIILVTSAEPQAGKTTVACNYAVVSSLSHSSVLLIEGDLRSPKVHELLGLERSPGLVDVIAADGELEEFVQRVPPGHLDVLTAGRSIPRSGDLTASERMGDLLRKASEAYDLVVIDAPPVLSVADAEGYASHPGVEVLMVVRQNTKRRWLIKAMRRLRVIEANVAGVVLNRWGRPNQGYYS